MTTPENPLRESDIDELLGVTPRDDIGPATERLPAAETPVDETSGDDDLRSLLAEHSGPRLSTVTLGLIGALLLTGAFAGGALVERGAGGSTTAGAVPGGPAQGGGRAFGGYGGFAGAQGGTVPGGAQRGAGSAQSAGGTADAPAAIGSVVSVKGGTLTIKNFAGKTVTVTVPSGTSVTSTTTTPLSSLKAGASVVVSGTTASDGTVTASGITTSKPAS
ncbi:hypothetical protein CLV35_2322 [Motilibacter peucedani]|uniref:DUF5666 domain-containing protein n=1 Tax=Motilibacter peucedani TaxID=598650 RepID=A0A420XNQ5_9ACTN|nr:hypothetical protein [Motilibacter peucedani]RKS73829.1 hypothetical protein CLV35_2322 [Motilibacter peucedani]